MPTQCNSGQLRCWPTTPWSHHPYDFQGEATYKHCTKCRIIGCSNQQMQCTSSFPQSDTCCYQGEHYHLIKSWYVRYATMTYCPCQIQYVHSTTLKWPPVSQMTTYSYDDTRSNSSHHCPNPWHGAIAMLERLSVYGRVIGQCIKMQHMSWWGIIIAMTLRFSAFGHHIPQ